MVVTDKGVRVSLEDIGEGEDGDAQEGEPTLLRFYVERLSEDGSWDEVDGASYCTRIRSDAPEVVQEKLVRTILQAVAEKVRNGESVRRGCAELSWLTARDLE